MKSLLESVMWLIQRQHRAKNVASLLLGLLIVAAFLCLSIYTPWFHGIWGRGELAVGVAIVISMFVPFCCVWLIWSAIENIQRRKAELRRRQEQLASDQKQRQDQARRKDHVIRENLESLSQWQRKFILRFITEHRSQIVDYEIGPYDAVWGPEVRLLVTKGILVHHIRAGIYEIQPRYRDYLIEHWDPESGTLG